MDHCLVQPAPSIRAMHYAGDALLPFLQGLVQAEVGVAGWRLWRHAPAQRARLAAGDGLWMKRGRCPSGIRLAMRGPVKRLRLELLVTGGCRPWGAVDLLVDGRLQQRRRLQTALPGQWTVEFTFSDDGRERRVECWLPHSLAVELVGLTCDGPLTPAPRRSQQLLCLGDSIVQGLAAGGPASCLAGLLANALDLDLINQGVGGHVFDADCLTDDVELAPNCILVAYGTNDWTSGLAGAELNDRAVAYGRRLAARWPTARRCLVTPIWRYDAQRTLPAGTLRDCGRRLAAAWSEAGCGRVPHEPSLLPDGIHPDDGGFGCYTLHLLSQLRRLGWETT